MSIQPSARSLAASLHPLHWRRPRVGWLAVPLLVMAGMVWLASALLAPTVSSPVPVREWQGQHDGGERHQVMVVRSNAHWQALWNARGREAPARLDGGRQFGVYIALGTRASAGYGGRLVAVSERDGRLVVVWEETSPQPGDMTAQVVTQPWLALLVDRPGHMPIVEQRIR